MPLLRLLLELLYSALAKVYYEVYLRDLTKFSAKKRRQLAPFKDSNYNLYCLLSKRITERGTVDARLSQEIITIETRGIRGQVVTGDIILVLKISYPCSC